MSVGRGLARLILFLILLSLSSAARATPLAPKQAPSQGNLICEVSPQVKQGGKGTIRGRSFTPNAEVDVTFNRPDGTSSNHTGKADGSGNFNGTFTVDRDHPAGAWTLILIDKPSGRSISTHFTVTPIKSKQHDKSKQLDGSKQLEFSDRIWENLERWLWEIAAILGLLGIFILLLIWWLFGKRKPAEIEQPDWEREAPQTGTQPPMSPPEQNDFEKSPEDVEQPPGNENQPPENK